VGYEQATTHLLATNYPHKLTNRILNGHYYDNSNGRCFWVSGTNGKILVRRASENLGVRVTSVKVYKLGRDLPLFFKRAI